MTLFVTLLKPVKVMMRLNPKSLFPTLGSAFLQPGFQADHIGGEGPGLLGQERLFQSKDPQGPQVY